MRVTLEDVAKRAGVSLKTLSRVVNLTPNVSGKTRQRVLQTIQEIGFVAHAQASNLASGR